ncbi:prepilin peptidase-dependent protein [Yersinia pekkanenii]|uniref:Prepilin peptidase dependent protein n=1 Tax=Yersinia pekkanenii TaxID=1288385 RepID=A0A0T9P8E7_9GAMM|nr:prepilin peptidase-dependent protein [Yersinia pekkanenii]CNH51084.1 putative prepilin peptidase dependent protein [Yersinia pekkanenii]CRY67859.1 putative prepilin peptidase dependent protein [Yersinia pekkanenii]
MLIVVGTGKTPATGFSLPEVMLALSIGSLIVLSATQVFPKLLKQVSILQQHYRLELVMRQVMAVLEKDLQRAGFCHGECQGKAVTTGNYQRETADSCLIVAYDLNRNGRWEGAKHQESEYFGYRLRNKALEGQRGELNCDGKGWERLFDPQDVTVTHFSVKYVSWQTSDKFFSIRLVGQKTGNPAISHQITNIVRGNNL